MKKNTDLWLAALMLLYVGGLIAIGVPLRPALADGLPWLLLLVLAILWLYQPRAGTKLLVYSLLGGCVALFVEVLNQHSGMFFGHLAYQHHQTFLVSGVPVSMVWVWALTLCTAGAAAWIADFGRLIHILFQALLMVVLLELIQRTGTIWEQTTDDVVLHAVLGRFGLSLFLSALMNQFLGRFDHLYARFAYSFTLLFLLALIFIIK